VFKVTKVDKVLLQQDQLVLQAEQVSKEEQDFKVSKAGKVFRVIKEDKVLLLQELQVQQEELV